MPVNNSKSRRQRRREVALQNRIAHLERARQSLAGLKARKKFKSERERERVAEDTLLAEANIAYSEREKVRIQEAIYRNS